MNHFLKRLFRDAPEKEQMIQNNDEPSGEKSVGITRRRCIIVECISFFVLLGLITYFMTDTLAVGAGSALDSFAIAEDAASEEAYQFFYDMSYDAAEKAHHVSNHAAITIGDLREQQKLEVLRVSDVAYETPKPEDPGWLKGLVTSITGIFNADMVSWLEVPGNGVFTVNLQAGEFIIDEERQYVLIRVPEPELTEFAIDYENVELLLFEKGGTFKNSAKYGVDKAREQMQSAELTMMQNVNNNQEFYSHAQEAAEKMLVNLVQQLNPQLTGLVVEVEFIS